MEYGQLGFIDREGKFSVDAGENPGEWVEPMGELWEPCTCCGHEPVYMPLYRCRECWPLRPGEVREKPPKVKEPREAPRQASQKTKEARQVVKEKGGAALTGTAKQKKWAEEIRAEIVPYLSEESARILCNKRGPVSKAKFWIERRTKTVSEFEEFGQKATQILDVFRAKLSELKVFSGSEQERIFLNNKVADIGDHFNKLFDNFS